MFSLIYFSLSNIGWLHWITDRYLFSTFGSCELGLQTWCCFTTIFFECHLFMIDTSLFTWRTYGSGQHLCGSNTMLTVQSPKRIMWNFSVRIRTQTHNTDPVQLELIKLYNINGKGKSLGRFVHLQHKKWVAATHWRNYFLVVEEVEKTLLETLESLGHRMNKSAKVSSWLHRFRASKSQRES